jgi:HJR/Mrr/RecB family endonuclease
MGTFIFILIVGLGWWAISNAVEAVSRVVEKGKDIQRSKEVQEAAKKQWGTRLNDRTKTLEERNEDIIQGHIERLDACHHRSHYLDDSIRDCIQDIAAVEGRLSEAPNHAYLYKWSQNASPEFQSLTTSLWPRFRERLDNLARLERERQQLEIEAKMRALQENYASLLSSFYEVAERKVSLRDDYGEERWDALDKEIETVLHKIATKENCTDFSRSKKYGLWMPEEYKRLSAFLNQSFRERHQRGQAERTQSADYTTMSGIEFEVYLIGLLSHLGFTDIRSTPATNDQGADLLAKKEGRTFVIQAKRYASPVGNGAVQEVVSALHFYTGDEGWVVTNSTFTQSAKELALRTGIKLVDGFDLARLRADSGGE